MQKLAVKGELFNMKNKLFKIILLFSAISLSSCNKDVYTKRIYLASKYTLKYAAYIENYTPNIGVAYFKKLVYIFAYKGQ